MTVRPTRRDASTARLVQRAAAGDREVAALLDDRYRRRLTRYARSLLGRSHHDAEDVVQDVLVKANAELSAGRGPEHLDAWMFRLTRNRAIDEMRRARWGEASLDAAPDGGEAITARATDDGDGDDALGGRAARDPAAIFRRRESMHALVQDLADLPVAQRDALLTRVVDGASPQESAERLGVSVEAVQMLVVRGRANLVRIRDLRQATGNLDRQLRLLAPPVSVIPLFGLAKLIGFGGPKVVGAVVAALAVVATATGVEVTHTQRAGAGDPAPFTLNARQGADAYFEHQVLQGQPIPRGNAVFTASVKIPAGAAHARGRRATLQCQSGYRFAGVSTGNAVGPGGGAVPNGSVQESGAVASGAPVKFSVGAVTGRGPQRDGPTIYIATTGEDSVPRADGKVTFTFTALVLAKPATVRLLVLCRKPGVGGNLELHPRVPLHGEGAAYTCTYTNVFFFKYRIVVGTLQRGQYVSILRRSGDGVFVDAPYFGRGWIQTRKLCRGYSLPTRAAHGPPLYPVSELGYPRSATGFGTAAQAKWYHPHPK